MHRMLEQCGTQTEKDKVKQDQLHGIELKPNMFTIASTNMILRGDGKSNIIQDDFFKNSVEKLKKKKATVGMMNPPYSQGKIDSSLYEIKFIEHLLDSLKDEARCAVIVPQSTMTNSNGEVALNSKRHILKHHTLEGVITCNPKTFYDVGVSPVIAIFTVGVPHRPTKLVKFINFQDDGYKVTKKGLLPTNRADERRQYLLDVWNDDILNVSDNFMVKSTIKYDDEWLYGNFYFNKEQPSAEAFEKATTDYLSFEFQKIIENKGHLFISDNNDISKVNINVLEYKEIPSLNEKTWKPFVPNTLFTISGTKTTAKNKLLKIGDGDYPYIITKSTLNGLRGCFDFYTEEGNVLTFDSAVRGFTSYQGYNFSASDHVEKLIPKFLLNKYIGLFMAVVFNEANDGIDRKGKFSYAYKASQERMGADRNQILLPVNDADEPDYEYMEQYIKNIVTLKYKNYIQYYEL